MTHYMTWLTISRLLKIIGLFCKRALQKKWYSAKETYNFKEPTNRSHPIYDMTSVMHSVHLCDISLYHTTKLTQQHDAFIMRNVTWLLTEKGGFHLLARSCETWLIHTWHDSPSTATHSWCDMTRYKKNTGKICPKKLLNKVGFHFWLHLRESGYE